MNPAHIHLLLNHIPVIGIGIGFVLLIIAAARRSPELAKVCFGLFVVMALVAIPTYLSGEPAEEIVRNLPGVSESIIEEHEEAALPALVAIELLGVVALVGLVLSRRSDTIPKWPVAVSLIVAVVAGALMVRTANLGGHVRHTEVRSAVGDIPSGESTTEQEKKEEKEEGREEREK